ncbi:MAG: hypothetical protein ABIJ16_11780 [Bacteroidota bacterium]
MRKKNYISDAGYRCFFIPVILSLFLVFASCTREEEKELKNYYSAGVISSDVISYTPGSASIKLKFFVLDKSNNDGLVRFDISDKLIAGDGYTADSYDSLSRIVTPGKGNYSAAVIISEGFDEEKNMRDFFIIMEPLLRKFIHASVPQNELVLAKAGNPGKPVELIGGGFITDPRLIDQDLAEIYHQGTGTFTDTLCLLTAIDSMMIYLHNNASYENRHLFIMVSRRKNFYRERNFANILYKAKNWGITCHLVEVVPTYTWGDYEMRSFLEKLNARSGGIYCESPFAFGYNYDYGELPMDMLQIAGRLPDMLSGNMECFEIVWTVNDKYSGFTGGKVCSWDFYIRLNTGYEQGELAIPVKFYIE